MEAKELALLMLIPLILIGIVLYTDKNPIITGAAVAQQKDEQSKTLGTYTINPSFKVKIDYDLSDYNTIKESLDNILKCAERGKDIESCVNDVNSNEQTFSWSLGCDKDAEKVLYDFAEFLQDCIDSDDNNCLCNKKFELPIDKIKEFEISGNYGIEISEDSSAMKLKLALFSPKTDLTYDVGTNGVSGIIPKKYFFSYSGNIPVINLIFTDISGIQSSLGPLNEVAIYKNDNNKNKIKSIDFVKQERDALIYPEPEAESEYSTSVPITKLIKKPSDLHPCYIKPKNTHKFCVTKKNYKILAYDKLDGYVKERPLTIKFASYVPDLPPAPLENIEIYDRPKAEKSVLVKWDKSDANDVAKYRIYYADSSLNLLEKTPTENLKKNPNVFIKELDTSKIITEELDNAFTSTDCEFDYPNKKCMFSVSTGVKIPIENDRIYYFKDLDSYIYNFILPEDNKKYDFAITAVDKNNNEIDNINPKQKLPVINSVKSIDDLPPDSSSLVILRLQQFYDPQSNKVSFIFLEKPAKNIDGTELNDLGDYGVYYMKYALLTLEDKAKAVNLLMDAKISNKDEAGKPKLITRVKHSQTGSSFPVDISSTNPQKENVYFFFIIATDNAGNPLPNQFKIKEVGAVPLQLTIT